MMKSIRHILLAIVSLAALTLSCVDPLEPIVPSGQDTSLSDALILRPSVLGITPVTKHGGVSDRGENAVRRLDVFVYEIKSDGPSFHKHYKIGDGTTDIATNSDYRLETNWRTYYDEDKTYRIYVIANINANKFNDTEHPENPTDAKLENITEQDLKLLVSESLESIRTQYNTSYDIVRLKNPDGSDPDPLIPDPDINGVKTYDHHIGNKLFVMDGKIDSWSPKAGSAKQYFTPDATQQNLDFNLSRAAAKFGVSLKFSSKFTEQGEITIEDIDQGRKFRAYTSWYDPETKLKPKTAIILAVGTLVPDAQGKVYETSAVEGGPRIKFANILKSTYNIAPEGKTNTSVPSATQQNTLRDENLWDSQDFFHFSDRTPDGNGGYLYPYLDTTYSYAFSWDPSEGAEKAPALSISVLYTTYIQNYNEDGTFNGGATGDDGVMNYYRIPLVDLSKTSEVKRNHFYQVDAEISTMGTSTADIKPTEVNLKYKVIPWPDAADMVTEAQTIQLEYFVAEKSYRLRGDGEEVTYLQYFTPKSDPIGTTGYNQATPKITRVKVYYNDQNGNERPLYTEWTGSAYEWTASDGNVSIKVKPSSTHNGGGNFQVTSTSLANRAVKYIEFDTEVDFGYLYTDSGNHKVPQNNIVVTHFPLDNIQSISGAWSSRWSESSSSSTRRIYSFNPTNDGWDSYDGYEDDIECTESEYNSADPNHRSTSTGTRTTTRANFLANVTTNENRAAANSEASSVNNYWGTSPSVIGWQWDNPGIATTSDNWDYYVSATYNGYTYYQTYKYDNYYTKAIVYRARRYYRNVTVNVPTVRNNWVNWDEHTGSTYQDNSYNTYQGLAYRYTAKYWGGYYSQGDAHGFSRDHVFNMSGNNSGVLANYNNYQTTESDLLNNNHMYIIQISKAEEGVILGRPTLNNNNQSQDNVVSPAFMIASQLGAVSTFDSGTSAATHCHTYMEVDKKGHRFVNWRLPTAAEIAYIVSYQANTTITSSGVFEAVLTGVSYYTLDGNLTNTNYPGASGEQRVRCVRDLTPKEVIELNETGTITDASY